MAAPYAWYAEAAVSAFYDALWLRDDGTDCERTICALFARSARNALGALLLASSADPPTSANLISLVARLERLGMKFDRKVEGHARLLSRVLILDAVDAAGDYLTSDLFGEEDVEPCERAAEYFVERVCRKFLGVGRVQAETKFGPLRRRPMVDTTLWQRRRLAVAQRASRRSR